MILNYTTGVDHRVMREKIKHVFSNVFWPGRIRCWVTTTSEHEHEHEHSMLAVACCFNNLDNLKKEVDGEEEEMMMLISGPPANAIVNRLPEVVLDLSVYKGNPLVDSALQRGFTCSLFLPVFIYGTTTCIGILDCSMTLASDLLPCFSKLKTALVSFQRVGLSTFHAQQCHPYKTICGLKCAKDEIQKALEIVSESHDSTLAQVWINYKTDYHVSKLAIKLIDYSAARLDVDDDLSSAIKGYFDACDIFPGPAAKTLQTSEPLCCRNINQLTDNGGLLGLLPASHKFSFLAICLRSIHTGDLDYAFEFVWPQSRNYLFLSESLLSTLKRCLPSFTFSFGAKHGDELRVLDVYNSLNAMDLRHKWVIKKCCSSLDVNCKTTSIPSPRADKAKIATGISEWHGRTFTKRKFSDFCETEIESTGESSASSINFPTSPASSSDKDTLFIAENEDDVIAFQLPVSSATLAAVKKEIDEGFELNGSYKLCYLHVTNLWLSLSCDENVIESITHGRTNHIRVKVQSSHV